MNYEALDKMSQNVCNKGSTLSSNPRLLFLPYISSLYFISIFNAWKEKDEAMFSYNDEIQDSYLFYIK